MKYLNQNFTCLFIMIILVPTIARATISGNSMDTTEAATITKTPKTVVDKPRLKTIALLNAGDYLILKCRLNGKSAYFMIDTGASFTVLHYKFAKLYDFEVLERRNLQTTGFGGGSYFIKIALGAKLQFGEQGIQMGFLAQDLSKMIRLIQQRSNVGIAGIIGTDLLSRLACKVDLGKRELHILQ